MNTTSLLTKLVCSLSTSV